MSIAKVIVMPAAGYEARCHVSGCEWTATADDLTSMHCAAEEHLEEAHEDMEPAIEMPEPF